MKTIILIFLLSLSVHAGIIDSGYPGVVAVWNFDDASGTTAKSTNGAYTMSTGGNVTWVTGKNNNGVNYLAANDYMYLTAGTAADFDFAGGFTLGCWVKFKMATNTTNGLEGALIAKIQNGTYNGYMLWYNEGHIRFYVNAGARANTTNAFVFGKWTHICAVYDGTYCKLYVDGLEVNRGIYTTAANSAAGTLYFSKYCDSYGIHMTQDEVFIANRAFSPTEVMAVVETGKWRNGQ